ncbi:MAG: bifunctional UDP-N-acetylglucosamine diphosphorylase/glucosamine-1-phosphate N-acetyltransferase GlmU [Pseudomonadales bacterium]
MPESKRTKLVACILAAGMGTRMRSSMPKVLHTLAGKPLLEHLLDTVKQLGVHETHVVIGTQAEQIEQAFAHMDNLNWVCQAEQLGTGHAVMQAMSTIADDARVLILLGDAPLVSADTLERLAAADSDLAVLSVDVDDPSNYGRILRGADGHVERIVEERDASEQEKQIREINTGVMVASATYLSRWLSEIDTNNDQKEYLLTDIVEVAANDNKKVLAIKSSDPDEVKGINNFSQLAYLERVLQRRQAEALMAAGVKIMDPSRFDVRGELEAGHDVIIDVNNIFEGRNILGNKVTIGANCTIRDSRIGDNCIIKPNTIIEESLVGNDCSVGPYARLRPGTELAPEVAVGNFVEVKKSKIGQGSKASHLAYLGDTTIGRGVNIGAGTITCNYDGVNKFETHIDDYVFVGSNTALVAPVTIGEGATIGAGSTITRNVDKGVLAIGRERQKTIENWKKGPKAS